VTLSYIEEEENNLPDYGIPFIDGKPAVVDRNNYYGLVDYDAREPTPISALSASSMTSTKVLR